LSMKMAVLMGISIYMTSLVEEERSGYPFLYNVTLAGTFMEPYFP
jgi:hypothetical protein